MAQADPNNRFLPPKQDFIYGDRMELLSSTMKPNDDKPMPPGGIMGTQAQQPADLYDMYKRPPSPKLDLSDDSFFYLNITGQIEHAEYASIEALNVKFDFVTGIGWDQIYVQSI